MDFEFTIKILHLEDDPSDAQLVQLTLRKAKINFEYFFADNEIDFRNYLVNQNIDLILSDYHLPDYSGTEALLLAKNNYPNIPFVFISGAMGEDAAIQSLLNGATDYVLKSKMERLVPAVSRAFRESQELKARLKAEEAIHNERKILRTLIDNVPDFIYVKDAEGRKLVSNIADFKNIGANSENEVIGKNDLELIPGPIGERGYNDDSEVLKSGKEIIGREELFINSHGEKHWTVTSKIPLKDKDGIVTGLVGVGHDISKRKEFEEKLLESYSFSESLLKTIPFGMDIVDEKGTILFQSEAFRKIFGDDAIGKKCWRLYRDNQKQCVDCPLLKGIINGKTETYVSDGVLGKKIFEISHTGMVYKGMPAMLEIFQDITQRKQDEIELIKAKEKAEESDRLKTSFLHNISHEIRTPMNAIIGFSGFLGDPGMTTEKRKYFNDIIQQGCNQLLSIISDIVSIATIEAGQEKLSIKEIDLNKLMTQIYDQFLIKAKMQNISLILNVSSSLKGIYIKSDEAKLIQILNNLVGNALKFTKQGEISFGVEEKGNELEFSIKDTGIGIAADMHQVIFERFRQVESTTTRQFGGSGLGLSISKAHVELLGGKIWLNSELDKGTTFYFTIPFKKSQKKTDPDFFLHETIASETGVAKSLLVAEDEDSNFMLLEELLSELNVTIIRASNGLEAVNLCKSNANIDMVLMDIKMPVMDGYEATRQIREFNPKIIIIAQTAYATSEDKAKAFESGCNDFVVKPFSTENIALKVQEYLWGRVGGS